MSHVAYFALGGTIAMTPAAGGGVIARLTGEQILATAGDLPVGVHVADPSGVPSASLAFTDLLDVVDAARAEVDAGAAGVVISQGTDTLEETAFLIDCVWDREAPIAVTGAMRNPTQPGHEGPANLRAAVLTAAAPVARGQGVLVVFADELHAARHVRKTHTSSIATFASPDLGPVGSVVEDTVRLLATVPRRTPVSSIDRERLADTRVGLYTSLLDAHPDDLAAFGGHQGLVVAGFGAGHVPGGQVPELAALAARIPVVLTSRVGSGRVLDRTYAAPGAEIDLLARGLIGGGLVHPYKARVLLRLLVAAGADAGRVRAAFSELS
jgi:L-asparaginase/Glu-tRNA(Gln) amidotransferase subunit D